MVSSIAYERVSDEEILEKYADTKEEAFNLLFSGMLIYRCKLISGTVVNEMLRQYPPHMMTKEEYISYGEWIRETEVTDNLLRIKRKLSLDLEEIVEGYTTGKITEAMKKMDDIYFKYERNYILGIDNVVRVVEMGIKMKLRELVQDKVG